MFGVRPDFTRRISFASKLYPKLVSPLNLEPKSSRQPDKAAGVDSQAFCGGRSKNRTLLTYYGFISTSSEDLYNQLPLFRRSLHKLTNLVETELEAVGGREILFPNLVAEQLWHKSNRLQRQQNALDYVFRVSGKDHASKYLLGPTFEESVTEMVANFPRVTESELPLLFYQTSTKFRRESQPRFGLIRCYEFCMNDLYSFDASIATATDTYHKMMRVYDKIFGKLSLKCLRIENEPGNIGGVYSHEYQLPVESGEDEAMVCLDCHASYNVELQKDRAKENRCLKCASLNVNRLRTLELGHTFLLSSIYSKPLRALFTGSDSKSQPFEMGCYGLGLTRILAAGVDLFSIGPEVQSNETTPKGNQSFQIRWPSKVEPFTLGIVSPARRSKQFAAGSTQFIEKLSDNLLKSTTKLDLIVEDCDKDGIRPRIAKLQAIGLPNIVVVGQRFLDETPAFELLELEADKRTYRQSWLSEGQLLDRLRRLDTI